MHVRPAVFEDGNAIAGLLTQLDYPGMEPFIAEKIQRLLKHPDAVLLVAEEKGEVLGFISLHFIPQIAVQGDFCRISYFCVGDGSRSAGVGKALETAAMQEAVARGCDRIELHCHSRRLRAHEFYFRQGFEESPKYLMKML
jgi:GNAT superfamily N-acetyltransferase